MSRHGNDDWQQYPSHSDALAGAVMNLMGSQARVCENTIALMQENASATRDILQFMSGQSGQQRSQFRHGSPIPSRVQLTSGPANSHHDERQSTYSCRLRRTQDRAHTRPHARQSGSSPQGRNARSQDQWSRSDAMHSIPHERSRTPHAQGCAAPATDKGPRKSSWWRCRWVCSWPGN